MSWGHGEGEKEAARGEMASSMLLSFLSVAATVDLHVAGTDLVVVVVVVVVVFVFVATTLVPPSTSLLLVIPLMLPLLPLLLYKLDALPELLLLVLLYSRAHDASGFNERFVLEC